MTNELNIMTSIKTQWLALTSSQLIDEWESLDSAVIAPTRFASQVRLGKNIINQLNSLAALTTVGYIEVSIKCKCINVTANWSLITDLMCIFGNNGYIPPIVVVGDNAQIDSLKLLTIEPPRYFPSRGVTERVAIYACYYHYF